ncbi:hypothetical protein [Candidatus Chlorohelix sp.]|uniref:hypothetical protein n=1 Tax=Candidatus Chlorohelix sp. TaxID=3139201 RepID=UPI0030646F7E
MHSLGGIFRGDWGVLWEVALSADGVEGNSPLPQDALSLVWVNSLDWDNGQIPVTLTLNKVQVIMILAYCSQF